AAGGGVEGIEESSVRALAKLEQVLPARLRHRVSALNHYTVQIPGKSSPVAPELLTTIANAARDRERLRFDYTGHDGRASTKDVEPHRLVHRTGRWYLVGWDTAKEDWRTYRVDRIAPRTPNGPRFGPRELPDVASFVERGVNTAMWRYRATILLHAPIGQVRELPLGLDLEPVDDERCLLKVGGDDIAGMAAWLGFIGHDFEVLDLPELAEAVRVQAERYLRAVTRPDS
ncbi:MAG: WYL domain-containing protein, partial [Nonomuraea sp.]|nr:WYL domain-containing protein [Nonomuraea sp.]